MADPWTKFRNLCSYYIDCVKYSEKRQEYLFTDQQNETFMLPSLEVNWHLKEEFDIQTSCAQRFARSVLLSAEEADEIFIGYPLTSFISPKGTHCLCPVMLFPVDITTLGEGRESGMKIRIDRQGIDINKDWVEFHVPYDRQNYFIRACERTSDEMGSIDVETALQYISHHFKMKMDPNLMDFTLRHSDAKHELLNTAALFIGGKTKYTRNLIKELNQIKNEPDTVLDKTALAYVFRDPPLPIESLSGVGKRIPALFTDNPLNAQQYLAVEEALNTPVTKVTGPPGTGKSHMAVNLIANEAFNGGRVLFTSKNHKAIHAVFEMCQKSKPHSDFDLVEFCTAPGNEHAAQWDTMKEKLEQVKDLVASHIKAKCDGIDEIPDEVCFHDLSEVEQGLNSFRDAEQDIHQYDLLRKRVARFERLIVETEELLSSLPADVRHSSEFISLLERCVEMTDEEPRLSKWNRLLAAIVRLLKKKKKEPDIVAQLKVLAPDLAASYSRKSSISKSARRFLKILRFRDVVEGWRLSEYDAIQKKVALCNYEDLKESLKKASLRISGSLKQAYVDQLCKRVRDLDVEDLINKVKGELETVKAPPLSFMVHVGADDAYDKAIETFHEFQKIFPAWAVTLLSLRKASPCLPGVYSLVLIDEASQCEIPPMIPALFRAERLAVVGDPDQFPPVITMKEKRNVALRQKYHLMGAEMNKFSFCENNVFSVIPRSDPQTIKLTEHFRCMDDIAMYFNEEFYKGGLCPCVGDRSTGGYSAYNLKPGMDWVDVPGGDDAEAHAAMEYLCSLKRSGFKGTVGVISPLRKLADAMKTLCFQNKRDMPEGLTDERINTANGFQGGQCDVIVFLLGLNGDRTPGRDGWYITADENKYIYNVSVSRAKVCFTTFGDKKIALESGISRIVKLIPGERKPISPKVGPGEIILQKAMESAGLSPTAQYPVLGRYLDLALVDKKIDIEIDGQAWHLDKNGCRKADDIHRDLLMEWNGWKVIRFWHNEVITDAAGCVAKIREICS